MTRVYTDEWNGFQFRAPTFLDGHFEPYQFDLVKWDEHDPYEATDFFTGQKYMSTKSCFSVGRLDWDQKDQSFNFRSIGLRYLEYHIDGLDEFVLDFCNTMRQQLATDD